MRSLSILCQQRFSFFIVQQTDSMPTTPSRLPKGNRLLLGLSLLLVLVLIGSGLGAYFTFFSHHSSPPIATQSVAGYAYFVSSGLLSANPNSNQGITDELQITLKNIPNPPSGKSYYAWLLNDKTLQWSPIQLGELNVNNGTAVLSFNGDAQHTDLLATNSRLFVTEEDATSTPVNPSIGAPSVMYYAEFSQIPNPADPKHFSLYDHVRHLLADDPNVQAAGLKGGLDIWLYRNTQKLLEWAGSVRDAQKGGGTAFMRRQLLRMLDYLDGTYYIQHDVPGSTLQADPTISKIGLLTFDEANQSPPGYVYHIGKHLREIASLPESTSEQKMLASQINQSLDVVNGLLFSMHLDALQLYKMTDAQLLSNNARNQLNTLTTLANEAFVGQINSQGQVVDGIVQIHYDIQRLATFTIKACTTNQPCPSLI